MSRACVIGILVWSLAGITYAADRDGARQAAAQDVSAQLLQEVRRLREAIETMVSTGARVQIVFGRLQLQEQRTATAARRLDDLREKLAHATAEASEAAREAQDADDRFRDSRATPDERARLDAEAMRKHFRVISEQKETERQRLQVEESQASAALADEQARWAGLNQQLEELERVLTKKGG